MRDNIFKFIKEDIKGIIISVKIIPNASINRVLGYCDEYLKVKITAPPLENKANKELVLYLSKLFGLPKTNISFVSGEKSKVKRFLLKGKNIQEIIQKISIYDNIDS